MGTERSFGPEAAVLSARLAELRAVRVQAGPEFAEDGGMWVEAAVIAGRTAKERVPVVGRGTRWERLRAAAGLPTRSARDRVSLAFLPTTARDRP